MHQQLYNKKTGNFLFFYFYFTSSTQILSSTPAFSLSVNRLHCPSSRSPSMIFSTRIRLSFFTSYSTAATIRRICLFLPSLSMIENLDEERRVISQGRVVYLRVMTVSLPSTRRTMRVRDPLSLSSILTHLLILSIASSSILP